MKEMTKEELIDSIESKNANKIYVLVGECATGKTIFIKELQKKYNNVVGIFDCNTTKLQIEKIKSRLELNKIDSCIIIIESNKLPTRKTSELIDGIIKF